MSAQPGPSQIPQSTIAQTDPSRRQAFDPEKLEPGLDPNSFFGKLCLVCESVPLTRGEIPPYRPEMVDLAQQAGDFTTVPGHTRWMRWERQAKYHILYQIVEYLDSQSTQVRHTICCHGGHSLI
jgi:hypothetical protein